MAGSCCWIGHAVPAESHPLEMFLWGKTSPQMGTAASKPSKPHPHLPPFQLPLVQVPQSCSADLGAVQCLLSNFCFCYHLRGLCLLKERLLVCTHKTDGGGEVCLKLL